MPVGEQPIQYNSTSGVKVLRVPYPHWYTSNIELHVNADNIAVVNVGYVFSISFILIQLKSFNNFMNADKITCRSCAPK